MQSIMERLGFEDDVPIESKLVTRAIENAQKRVEGYNFDIRKIVLQYDDVINQQRSIIYKQRRDILELEEIHDIVLNMIDEVIERTVEAHCSDEDVPEDWDLQGIIDYCNGTFLHEGQLTKEELWGKEKEEIIAYMKDLAHRLYEERREKLGEELMREFEKAVVLRAVDSKWMDHIDAMDQLRQGIHLRAYGGTDPLREYQFEGYEMFQEMIAKIQEQVATYVMKAHVEANVKREAVAEAKSVTTNEDRGKSKPRTPVRRTEEKIGRNDPCPCGSGKKYKYCHGAS